MESILFSDFRFLQAFIAVSIFVSSRQYSVVFVHNFCTFDQTFCQFCHFMLQLLTVVLMILILKIKEDC